MKKLNELTHEERENLALILDCWLSRYIPEVQKRVMKNIEKIISDETTMKMLENLYHQHQLAHDFSVHNFKWYLEDPNRDENFETFSNESHYVQVLWDLYIKK